MLKGLASGSCWRLPNRPSRRPASASGVHPVAGRALLSAASTPAKAFTTRPTAAVVHAVSRRMEEQKPSENQRGAKQTFSGRGFHACYCACCERGS